MNKTEIRPFECARGRTRGSASLRQVREGLAAPVGVPNELWRSADGNGGKRQRLARLRRVNFDSAAPSRTQGVG